MKSNKLTAGTLRKMIEDTLTDFQLIAPYPLAEEPPEHDPTMDPPEEDEEINEDVVRSYKGTRGNASQAQVAHDALLKCSDKERKIVFDRWNVQTYDEFLLSLAKYERAKKPK